MNDNVKEALLDGKTTIQTEIEILSNNNESVVLTEKNGVVSWDYEDFRHVKDEGFIGQFIARKVNGTIKNISDDFNMTDKEFILKMGVNVYPDYERIYLNEDSDGKYRLIGNSTQETRSDKNLFDYYNNFMTSNQGLINTINNDGSITVSGKPTGDWTRITPRIDITNKLEDGQKYSLWQENNDESVFIEIRQINKETNSVVGYIQRNSSFTASPNNYKYDIALLTKTVANWGNEERTVTGFYQLEKGDKTFFEKPGPMPSPDFPSEIVNTLNQGTYQTYLGNDNYIFDLPSDLAGIGDVKNELVIDKENGTFEFNENIRKIVLDGSEEGWGKSSSYSTDDFPMFFLNSEKIKAQALMISDLFEYLYYDNSEVNHITSIAHSINIKISTETIGGNTIEDFKSWLSENPVTVYYQLATPNVITGTLTKKEYDTTWYNLGNFLVTKVTDDEVNDKTTFEALDYTKRFNQRYNDTITYPCTALDLARNVCEQCGCELGSTSFKNSDFEIKGNVFTNGETCRDVMKQIGKLAFSWVRVDLDNKVYIDFTSNKTVDEYNKIDNSKYYTLKTQKEKIGAINRVVIGYKDIEGERTKLEDADDITANGVHEITVFDNPLVYNQELREKVIKQAQNLIGLEYMPMEILTVGHPWLKGDELLEVTDMEGKVHKTIPLDRTIQYFGHIKTKINVGTNTKTNTELAYDSGVGGRLRRTEIIVNKIDGTISEILEYQDETTTKLNETISSVDETKQTISKVETKVEDITTTTITSSGGNSLHLTEVMESNALDYKIDGNSYQEVRSGKNQLDITQETTTVNGVTFTNNNDCTFNVSGTATANTTITLGVVTDKIKPNTSYYLYSNVAYNSNTFNLSLKLYKSSTDIQFITANKVTTSVDSELVRASVDLYIPSGTTINQNNVKVMLVESSVVDNEWERYGATPTVDYPSEVEVVKGYNKLDTSDFENGYYDATGLFVEHNTNAIFDLMPVKKGSTYILTANQTMQVLSFQCFDENKNWIKRVQNNKVKKVTLIVSSDISYIRINANLDNATIMTSSLIKTLDLQLIEDKSYLPYLPYLPYGNIGVKTINKNFFTFGEGSITTIGLTTTFNKSEYTINGTTTNLGNVFGEVKFIDVFPPGTYKYSSTLVSGSFQRADGGAFATYLRDNNNKSIREYSNTFDYSTTFTLTETTPLYLQMFSNIENKGGVFDNCVIRVQIENDDTFTEYEEHQEKVTYVDLRKDNLFDKDNANILDVYISSSTQIIGDSSNDKCLYIPIVGGKTYTILKTLSKIFRVGFTDELPEKGVACNPYIENNNVNSITVISNTNNKYLVVEYWVNTDTLSAQEILDSIKIYEGAESEDSWKICRIGYEEDKYDITTGILTKQIRKVIFNGNETWVQRNNGDGTNTISFTYNVDNIMGYGKGYIQCDSFSYEQSSSSGNEGIGISAGLTEMYIQINRDRLETLDVDGFKKWLSENPVTVYYILKEPYEVVLKPTNIPLFEGINNVSLLSTLDTNTYIKYLRKTPLSDDYATNQQLNQTNENLANTDNKTSLNATEINNTNNKLNNDYYNKTQVDSMNTTTENRITQIENTVETTKTATDYQISILQKQLEDGVTILDTKTGYVFDKDGLKISKSDSEMNSQLDHDGLIIKRNDTEVLSVRSDGVVTENLKVKTYFTIGKNTHVEDYKDGTGFFYIGGAE